MADSEARGHERQAAAGDVDAAAEVLRGRLRRGELARERLEAAAALGHPAAQVLVGPQEQESDVALQVAAQLLNLPEQVRVVAEWAEQGLALRKARDPDEDQELPRAALAAALAWADCPCDDHAGHALVAVGVEVDDLDLPFGAETTAFFAAGLASGLTEPDYGFADAFDDAVSWRDGEHEPAFAWQRLRLAAYLLGEA